MSPHKGRRSHTNHAVEIEPVQSSGIPSSAPQAEDLRRFVCFQILIESYTVAERIDDLNAPSIVEGRFDPRPKIFVVLRRSRAICPLLHCPSCGDRRLLAANL